MNRSHISSIIQALIAALLFGASAPLAKILLGEVEPIPLAAFLYLGSGIGLLGVKLFQCINKQGLNSEAQINKSDYLWLAGAIIAGGIAAPIVLLFSLKHTPAATVSLLLSFEGVATTLIAFFAFKESISHRAWWAIVLITLASIFLSVNLNAEWGFSLGALGIIAACILWGIDNNFTRNISAKDPITIVTIKGLGAGSFSLGMALVLENKFPVWEVVVGALVLGSLSYGASIVLFIHAMRGVGAARTSALFSSAPLAGMILSFLLFQEFPSWIFIIAFPLMVIGTLFLISEEHEHDHVHEMTIHEHAHVHDDGHHEHDHEGEYAKKHCHVHTHDELIHTHHHMPDRRHGPGRHPLHATGRPFVRKEFPSARTTLRQGSGQGLPPEFNRCQFPHGPSLTHLLIMIHRATDLQPRQSASAIERMDFLDLAGEQLYYALHCAQNPSAQILLAGHFVTERPFSYALWVRWSRHLASRGISALRFDYRGCGESTGEFHRFTLATWLEDCRAMLGLLKAENPKQPILLGGIGLGGLLVSQLFAEGQGDGMLLWSPAANGAGALRDTLLRRLAFDLANPTTGQPKTWADYETSLQQGESIEAAGYTLSAALWQEAVAMKFILPAGGRDQGIDSRGRPWKVVKLGQAHVPLIPGGGLWQALNPGLSVRRAPLSPDLSGFFEEDSEWIRSKFTSSTATS